MKKIVNSINLNEMRLNQRHMWKRAPVQQVVPNKKRKNRQELKKFVKTEYEDDY